MFLIARILQLILLQMFRSSTNIQRSVGCDESHLDRQHREGDQQSAGGHPYIRSYTRREQVR